MIKIYKFPIETTDVQNIAMPSGAEILCVQVQHGIPCLWARVDAERPSERRTIYIIGTGNPAGHVSDKRYIGTYQLMNGQLIFHVFE